MFRYTPLQWSENHTPYSFKFQDYYFSQQGGLAQSHHVFLEGNQLSQRWHQEKFENFIIGELGFGTGLNFLNTWLLWNQAVHRPKRLHYLSIESHPLNPKDIKKVFSCYPELQQLYKKLEPQLPKPLPGFHRIFLEDEKIILTLLYGDAEKILPQLEAQVDAWFLDGFAPKKNPELWSVKILGELDRLSKPESTLATYTTSGEVRRNLESLGFKVEKRPGFGNKRECLAGFFSKDLFNNKMESLTSSKIIPYISKDKKDRFLDHSKLSQNNYAVIVGAGLAGCSLAYFLTQRGWHVTLIEKGKEVGHGASGGKAGILFPYFSINWDLKSEFYWSGLFFSERLIENLNQLGHSIPTEKKGMVILPRFNQEPERFQKLIDKLDPENQWLQLLTAQELTSLAGLKIEHPGIYMPEARWVNTKAFCEALIKATIQCAEENLCDFRLLLSQEVSNLEQKDKIWQLEDAQQNSITETSHLILANGAEARKFLLTQNLGLEKVRGQTTGIPADSLEHKPQVLLNYGGYLIPLNEDTYEIGASFEREDERAQVLAQSHQANLQLLTEALPGTKISREIFNHLDQLAGRVAWRAVRKNRWPLIGSLNSQYPGLYLHLAHGSKGLISCPLGSEYLASYLNGEPLPISKDLIKKLKNGSK